MNFAVRNRLEISCLTERVSTSQQTVCIGELVSMFYIGAFMEIVVVVRLYTVTYFCGQTK